MSIAARPVNSSASVGFGAQLDGFGERGFGRAFRSFRLPPGPHIFLGLKSKRLREQGPAARVRRVGGYRAVAGSDRLGKIAFFERNSRLEDRSFGGGGIGRRRRHPSTGRPSPGRRRGRRSWRLRLPIRNPRVPAQPPARNAEALRGSGPSPQARRLAAGPARNFSRRSGPLS